MGRYENADHCGCIELPALCGASAAETGGIAEQIGVLAGALHREDADKQEISDRMQNSCGRRRENASECEAARQADLLAQKPLQPPPWGSGQSGRDIFHRTDGKPFLGFENCRRRTMPYFRVFGSRQKYFAYHGGRLPEKDRQLQCRHTVCFRISAAFAAEQSRDRGKPVSAWLQEQNNAV